MLDHSFTFHLYCFFQFCRAYYHILYILVPPWTAHQLTGCHTSPLHSVVSRALSTPGSLHCLFIRYYISCHTICCCDLGLFSRLAHPTLLVQPSSVYHYIIGIIPQRTYTQSRFIRLLPAA